MSCLFRSHQSNFVLFPPKLEGCTVVDLGCGVGRDVFILSKLVGEYGHVFGVDSDKEQVTRRNSLKLTWKGTVNQFIMTCRRRDNPFARSKVPF